MHFFNVQFPIISKILIDCFRSHLCSFSESDYFYFKITFNSVKCWEYTFGWLLNCEVAFYFWYSPGKEGSTGHSHIYHFYHVATQCEVVQSLVDRNISLDLLFISPPTQAGATREWLHVENLSFHLAKVANLSSVTKIQTVRPNVV